MDRDEDEARWIEGKDNPRAALTDHQSAGEPAAWMYDYPGNNDPRFQTYAGMTCREEDDGMIETPLYAAPQPAPVSMDAKPVDPVENVHFIEALRLGGSNLTVDFARNSPRDEAARSIAAHAATLQKLAKEREHRLKVEKIAKEQGWELASKSCQLDALTAKLAEEREARLISEACAVKTHEMLMEALDAEKANLAKLTDMMVRYLKPETYVDVNGKAWPTGVARIAFINDVIYTLDPPKS